MGDEDNKPGGEPRSFGKNCDDVTEAAIEVEQKLSRMQDTMTEMVQPGSDEEELQGEIVAELDVAPEVDDLREALGMDEDGSRELPRGRPRKKQDVRAEERAAAKAKPSDTPPEYNPWRTGP
jgi:hypothetical protein